MNTIHDKKLREWLYLELLNHDRFDEMTETYKQGRISVKNCRGSCDL